MKSQHELVVDYIDKHGYISSIVASKKLNIVSLQPRITLLRRLGYVIPWEWRKTRKNKRHKVYWIAARPKVKK